ncbi:MAG: glycosyltransferase family 4 protein [Flavobacteriales bacterium]|nr:glycosyltransferase family 4 protein [Flavobacteriales bacterium]
MKTIGFIAEPFSIHDAKWINLLANEFEVIVICFPFSSEWSSYLNSNIKILKILPDQFPRRNFLKRWYHLILLKFYIFYYKIDIIHSMYAYPYAFWAELINFKNHVITTRGSDMLIDYKKTDDGAKNGNKIDSYFIKLFHLSFNNAKLITCTSYKQKKVVETFVKQNIPIEVIRTGIDIEKYKSIFESTPIDYPNTNLIFSPRAMKELYNIDTIVDAFDLVKDKIENCMLVLINEFPQSEYWKKIEKKLAQKNLKDRVLVIPKQTPEQMIYWYKNSTIIVSIPNSDGTPNSVLEAMLAKKPIIIGEYDYDTDLFSKLTTLPENTVEYLSKAIELEFLKRNENIEKIESSHSLVEKHASLTNSVFTIKQFYNTIITNQKE